MGTDPIVSQKTTVGVSIACQTSDTDPIVVSNNKIAPTITFIGARDKRGNLVVLSIINRSRVSQA